jgi:nitrite reductase/ring-hydroxylating ferredoxin subunit
MGHFYTDEEYQELTRQVDEIIQEAEELPYPNVRDLILSLLQTLDLLHREGLSRLMDLIEQQYPDLKDKMEQDFGIKTLFGLYDLLENEMMKEEEKSGGLPEKAFIPIEEVTVMAKRPIWIPAGNIDDLEPKKLYVKNLDGNNVLLCKIEDELFAMEAHCIDSILTLEVGQLEGYHVICPWHSCKYDIRTGELEGTDLSLKTFPIEVDENGDFSVGFNIKNR